MSVTIDPSFLAMPMAQQPTQGASGQPVPTYLVGGSLFTFQNPGDAIPPHAHAQGEGHIVVCLAGQVRVDDQTAGLSMTLTDATGQGPSVLYINDTNTHAVTGLSPGAVTLHVRMATVDPAALANNLKALSAQVATLLAAIQNLQALIGATATPVI